MALFKSVPAISTQKDTSKPIGKKPEAKVTAKDLEIKEPMSSLEGDEILRSRIKEVDEDAGKKNLNKAKVKNYLDDKNKNKNYNKDKIKGFSKTKSDSVLFFPKS